MPDSPNSSKENDLTAKALDLLRRLQEDPDKAHLLPPTDASVQELHKWYEEMSKPVRLVPFPTPSKEHLRRDRISRAIQSGQNPDPDDLAEEEADKTRYERKVAEAFEKARKDVLAESANSEQEATPHVKTEAKRVGNAEGGAGSTYRETLPYQRRENKARAGSGHDPRPVGGIGRGPISASRQMPEPSSRKMVVRDSRRGEFREAKLSRDEAPQPVRLLSRFRVFRWIATHPKTRIGSGLAMAASALGTQLSGAVKLAALFYFISWAIWSLVIYFSPLWLKSRKRSTAIIIVLGIAVSLFWWALLPSPPLTKDEIAEAVAKRINAGNTGSPSGTPVPASPVFHLRHEGAFVFSTFPSALLYKYGTHPNVFLAPVGVALNLEAVNNRPTKTRIVQYYADIQSPDGWVRILNLPMFPPREIYFLNEGSMRRAFKASFTPGIFDSLAVNKVLEPGESVQGWVFFEWPLELRGKAVQVLKTRITVKNTQGETAQVIFDKDSAIEPGASGLGGGRFGRDMTSKEIDLSWIPIKPVRD